MKIEFAGKTDLEWLSTFDNHLSVGQMNNKIEKSEILIHRDLENKKIGFLRFGFFWDEIPFINLLFIIPEYRNLNFGSLLLNHFENEMKSKGFNKIMTSTLSNETAQHFYRKIGYSDIGSFFIDKEGLELIFEKNI